MVERRGRRWHKEIVGLSRPKQNGCPAQEVKRGVGDGDTDGVCEHGEGRYGVSVRVAHEHAGEMGAIYADVDVVERTDVEMPLIVSMSFEESVEGVISLPEMEGLTMIRQRRKRSQFEHYKALAELNWGDGTWVMFTDDDDLWHEARAEAYVTMLQECKKRGVRPAYVVSKTIVATEEDDPPGLERAEDVTALFERGVISQEAFDKKDVGRMEGGM